MYMSRGTRGYKIPQSCIVEEKPKALTVTSTQIMYPSILDTLFQIVTLSGPPCTMTEQRFFFSYSNGRQQDHLIVHPFILHSSMIT
jgi:hypothetical protein